MKTSITLNKQDIEEIIAQRFGVPVERVVLSTPMEMVGYGLGEREERTIAGLVNLDNPGWPPHHTSGPTPKVNIPEPKKI